MLEIKKSEDGFWRYRLRESDMWIGGFSSGRYAYIAACADADRSGITLINLQAYKEYAT